LVDESGERMLVLALIGLAAFAVAAIAVAGIWLRAGRQSEEPLDPVRVEREVYDYLYGGGPALSVTPTRPRQRAQRSREKLNTKRPATGRAAQ
jgi:uncharacterized membrane protein